MAVSLINNASNISLRTASAKLKSKDGRVQVKVRIGR